MNAPAPASLVDHIESLGGLSTKRQLLALVREKERRLRYNRLKLYRPYPKQFDFHELGREKRERMLKAGNQQGKTLAAGAEVAMHLTGLYPDWWTGRRWDRPITAWASGVTGAGMQVNWRPDLSRQSKAWHNEQAFTDIQ